MSQVKCVLSLFVVLTLVSDDVPVVVLCCVVTPVSHQPFSEPSELLWPTTLVFFSWTYC